MKMDREQYEQQKFKERHRAYMEASQPYAMLLADIMSHYIPKIIISEAGVEYIYPPEVQKLMEQTREILDEIARCCGHDRTNAMLAERSSEAVKP